MFVGVLFGLGLARVLVGDQDDLVGDAYAADICQQGPHVGLEVHSVDRHDAAAAEDRLGPSARRLVLDRLQNKVGEGRYQQGLGEAFDEDHLGAEEHGALGDVEVAVQLGRFVLGEGKRRDRYGSRCEGEALWGRLISILLLRGGRGRSHLCRLGGGGAGDGLLGAAPLEHDQVLDGRGCGQHR